MSFEDRSDAAQALKVLQLHESKFSKDKDSPDNDSCSHSGSCSDHYSSCSSLTDYSDDELGCVIWESAVKENGHLNFILSYPQKQHSTTVKSRNVSPSTSATSERKKGEGKFVRLIRRRKSKRHRKETLSLKDESVQKNETPSSRFSYVPSGAAYSCENNFLYDVELKVDPWVLPNLGRRASLSETLLGLVTSSPDNGSDVFIVDYVPDGLAAKECSIKIGDKVVSVNGVEATNQNFNSILETIKSPSIIHIVMCSHSRHVGSNDQDRGTASQKISSKTLYQTQLAKFLSGEGPFTSLLHSFLVEIPVAVLYLQLDGLTEGGSEEQGVVYCYPGNVKSNTFCAIRGAFLTLQQLIPDITHSAPVSSSLIIQGQLTHVAYVEENRELLLLAFPDNRCSLPETVKVCSELVKVLQFTYQSLSRCFNSSLHHMELDHFLTVFLTRALKHEKWHEIFEKADGIDTLHCADQSPQFESLLPAAHWTPLPTEAQIQIDDALSELESNDLGDMCDDHDCQRLYTTLGCCIYHKGYLLASHLIVDDLLDIHAFCRQQGLLYLNQTEPVLSLIVWREVFPSSVLRENRTQCYQTVPKGRWFILIVGQKYDMLVMLLEAGGCSSSAEGVTYPDTVYVEAAQDTLRHLQKTGVTSVASAWLEANLRPQVTTPEAVVTSKTSPRRVNHLLGLRLPQDSTSSSMGRHSGFLKSSSSSSVRKSSDSLLHVKRRPSPDHSGSGPVHGETSEDSVSLAASLPSDDTGPLCAKSKQMDQEYESHHTHSDHDQSEDSDSDWGSFLNQSSQRFTSSTDFSSTQKSLVKKIDQTVPSKITSGLENSVFFYINVDVSEGVLLCPVLSPTSSSSTLNNIVAKFRSCAMKIHTLLQNSIFFKKLKGIEVNQSHINKSLVAIKEFGALFEYHFPSQVSEKNHRSLTFWVVGRLFFTPLPREVYVCYHDSAPQNMVELAFRLSLTSVG